MVNEINPELRYYCAYANIWFKDSTFCKEDFRFKKDGNNGCRYFSGTKEGYGKPLQLTIILCNYPRGGSR